jgi:hypothetical protein
MIAVSSLQENVHYRGRALQSTTLPERLYVKHLSQAIGALTASGQPPAREVVLMSCLLFLACENLKQCPSTAQLHVQSGLKLLREWKEENGRRSYFQSYISDSMDDVIENNLEPIFARLEAQISLTKEPCESRLYFRHYDLNWERPVVPEQFPDLFGARDSTHDIVQWSFYQTRLAGGPLLADNPAYRSLARLYDQWNSAFAASFPQRDDREWPAWTSAAALRVHTLALTMSMHAEALESTTYWDEHLDDVKWMLGVSSDIITSGPPPTDQRDSLWLYDFCLTPPLLLTALNCRHPALRRKAITLMRIQHCWDNKEPLDACGTAKLCELVVKMEEAGLPESLHSADDVPAASRIRPLMVCLSEPGKISVFHDRVGDSTVLQSTIDWDHWIPPPQDTLFIYPLGEMVKYGQFQGIIRPSRMSCMCKTYGAPDKDEWKMHV